MKLKYMINENLNIYLQALNSANSGIIITDNLQPDNPIIYCNSAFEKYQVIQPMK